MFQSDRGVAGSRSPVEVEGRDEGRERGRGQRVNSGECEHTPGSKKKEEEGNY